MAQPVVQLTEEHAQQLLIAKYLYREGARALSPQLPMSAGLAVSLFQDACELVIWTIAKDVDGQPKNQNSFPALWDAVQNGRRNGGAVTLPLRGQIEDLNKARVNFKHHGQLPTAGDALRFAGYTYEFLREAFAIFYGQSFDDLSLANLIGDARVLEKIKEAEAHRRLGEHQEAVVAAAEAAEIASKLLREVIPKVHDDLRRVGRALPRELGDPISAGFSNVADHLNRHVDMLTILSLQIPIADYFRFRALAPSIARFGDGRAQVAFSGPLAMHNYEDEESKFCVDYVTELALKVEAAVSSPPPKSHSGGAARVILKQ